MSVTAADVYMNTVFLLIVCFYTSFIAEFIFICMQLVD